MVENGKAHVFGKVWINEEEFFDQTSKLKKALPQEIKEAEKIRRDSERIMNGAHNEAQRLITDAQNEAQRLVGDARANADRTIQDARTNNDRIIEDARREAERILADAKQHAEQLVSEHVITQRAQEFGELTQQTAVREAQTLRDQADEYALEILDKSSTVLQRLLMGIEEGKNQIHQQQQQGMAPDTPQPPTATV